MKRIQKFLCAVVLTLLALGAWADAPGKNGARTIAAANTVINQYDVLASAAAAGATSITVNNIANLSSGEATGGGALATGDVVMLYQARGATIDTTNTPAYGTINIYGNAGNYELRTVRSVSGNVIELDGTNTGSACVAGLKNSYSAGAQVIRVPQYSSLTVNGGASMVASAWNGSTGGVVSALVQGALSVAGSISVSGQGFRGGIRDGTDRDQDAPSRTVTFASNATPAGGAKGEGIASEPGNTVGGVAVPFTNPGGSFDIGAPANGGGGGGSHNGGGGGGANAAAALTPYCTSNTSTYTTAGLPAITWCGQGVMPGGVTGAVAWQLDPGYKANGNALTNFVGGGRGGYTFSSANLNATTAAGAPGLTTWGGDFRRALGGWGGRPLDQTLASKLFFGGGGGAGGNNPVSNTGGAGGAGGGIILIEAGSLSGAGSITANGSAGANTTGSGNDGPGGGGAGGTIIVAGSGSVGNVTANGGAGGNQAIATAETEGPGGGGGGGLITAAGTANGGAGGTTNGSSLTEFPRNGSTDGSAGLTGQTAPSIRTTAASCTSLSIAKSNNVNSLAAGGTTTYTLTVVNSGPSAADGLAIRDPAVTGLSCGTVSCTAVIGGAVCPTAGSTTIAYLQGATGIIVPTLPGSSTATFTLNCSVTATGQ